MVREWGSLLGSRVSEALVGSGQGGDALDGEVKAAAASMEGVDDGGGAQSSEGEPDGKDGGGGGGGGGRAAGRSEEDGDGSGSAGGWALPEEMRAHLRELFGKIDKNKNGVLDSEERDEMREEVRLILMELGIGANVFERLQAGANYEEIEAWVVFAHAVLDMDISIFDENGFVLKFCLFL